MPDLSCYFLDKDMDSNPSLEKYKDYFLKYDPEVWSCGAGDGVFDVRFENGDNATLSVLEGRKLGISVRYNFRKFNDSQGQEFYSVGSKKQINVIKDVGDDQFAPVGSFLEPEQAWLAVEDFFNNPRQKSSRIQWIAADQINWPEV